MTALIVDLSNNNEPVSIYHLKTAGAAALYHKATEGDVFLDSFFRERRAAAHNLQLPFGAYHFGHVDRDPVVQAAHFCNVVESLGHRDLLPALDLETGDPGKAPAWAHEFNQTVRKHLGVLPMFYSNPDYIARMHAHKPVGNGLWLASYSRDDGRDHPYMVPAPWRHVALHQFTSVGRLNGVPMKVDLSHARSLDGLWAHPLLGRL